MTQAYRGHKWVVTNGQRAAICGLVIAGVAIAEACKIVRAPYRSILDLLPPRWHKRRGRGPARWKGDELEQVRVAYLDPLQTTNAIAARHNVTRRAITMLARRHGWKRRRMGRKPKYGPKRGPAFLPAMSREQRRLYNKLRPVLGREASLAEARR